jgi:hypothetical protein
MGRYLHGAEKYAIICIQGRGKTFDPIGGSTSFFNINKVYAGLRFLF